jgi:class 3 adenylate cyclase
LPLDYRVSADYGSVVIMNSNAFNSLDMIGPPVNMCSKINRSASKNGIVIGGDLYQLVKKLDYTIKPVRGFALGFKVDYPVYSVQRSP